jgi:hypothetical protein
VPSTAETAPAHPVEVAGEVEVVPVEVGDQRAGLLEPVGRYRADQVLAEGLRAREVGERPGAQLVGQGELGAGLEPAGEVVPARVVHEGLLRHRGQRLLEPPQVGGAAHLGPVPPDEDEVAEPEVVEHHVPQLLEEQRRPLEQEVRADAVGEGLVLGPRGVQDDRHVGPGRPHLAGELGPRLGHLLPRPRELDVRDDAQHLVRVAPEGLLRLLPRGAEQDLRPRPHAQDLLREVQALDDHALRVVQQLRVHDGQERGVVPDVVLDEDDHLDPDDPGVVLGVPPVLDRLDDAHEHPRVALPQEGPLDGRGVLAGLEVGELPGVPGEEDDGHVQALGPRAAGELGRVHVREVGGRDDQVHPAVRPGHAERLHPRGDAGEAGRVVQVEVPELAQHPLGELAGLLEDERVVGGRHEQDVHDAVLHQVLVVVEPPPSGRGRRHGALASTED